MTTDNKNFYLPHEQQIHEYIKTIDRLKKQNKESSLFCAEIEKLEKKLEALKKSIYSRLTPWERVLISRHPQRPKTEDYLQKITSEFVELSGDRTFKDDHSVLGGFATIGSMKCVIIGQEKGSDTESRIKRNFGMLSPEGFRKARRLMKLAEKFSLPIVSLIDTPGAYPGLEAEQRGQGLVIAENLREMATLKVPVIVLIIGEGSSGGALGMAVGNAIGMLEHAYYSVISPEGCASILWKDAKQKELAAEKLKLNAEDLLELGIIDDIIKEPLGGAHHDPDMVYANVKDFIITKYQELAKLSSEELIEQRYEKFRQMGHYTEA